MLTLVLAALTAVHTAAATPVARVTDPTPVVAEPARSAEHIAKARKALDNGELPEARREFVIASALDRDEGRLPIESSFGLAQVLYSQFDEKGAARVLDALADEASARNDVDTEARALTDAVWLNVNTKQLGRARQDAERLKALMADSRLSPAARAYVASRVR
jgi:hypothetical protein